jgi:heme-degrading monooxygenase HmoA
MFLVIFDVRAKPEMSDVYAKRVALLKRELAQIDGFVDQTLYRSLTRDGWLLSVSTWRDEKAVVRWRTQPVHSSMQQRCRSDVFVDYHLRVGQLTQDTALPAGHALMEQRLDVTEVGEGNTTVLINAPGPRGLGRVAGPVAIAEHLGLAPDVPGLASWDLHQAVETPGKFVLQTSWRDPNAARAFEGSVVLPDRARLRSVRVIRDYTMRDRREAPQFFPPVG